MSYTFSHPPHHLHSTTPIPPSHALSLLSTYLTSTTHSAFLHPNALLTENGPESTTSGANIGLVLYNLRRVERELKGEILGTSDANNGIRGDVDGMIRIGGEDDGDMGRSKDGDEWQDMQEFERGRDAAEVGVEWRGAEARNLDGMGVPRVATGKGGKVDKEERKRRKKERRKVEMAEKERKRREAEAGR